MIKKLLCKVFGCNYEQIELPEPPRGFYHLGWLKCKRCGHTKAMA